MTNDRTPLYGIGDKVKVVKYGGVMWHRKEGQKPLSLPLIQETDDFWWYDTCPECVGKEAIITYVTNTQNRPGYSLKGDFNKRSWFNEEQLELISKNPNNL